MNVPRNLGDINRLMKNDSRGKTFRILTDFDDILVDLGAALALITVREFQTELSNEKVANELFDAIASGSLQEVRRLIYNRPTYYLGQWLGMDDKKIFAEYIKCAEEVYKEAFHMPMLEYFTNPEVKGHIEVSVLTHHPEDIDIQHKVDVIRRIPGCENIQWNFHVVPPGTSKGDFIIENHLQFDSYFEDRLDILEDVIDKAPTIGKVFYTTDHGYNSKQELDRVADKISARGGKMLVMSHSELSTSNTESTEVA